MILADIWADSRQQRKSEIADLKQQVQEWKEQIQANRESVKKELAVEAKANRQTLTDFVNELQKSGDEGRKQRQQEQEDRQQESSDRAQEVAMLLEDFANQRGDYRIELSTNAQALGAELRDFHQNLQNSVWGLSTNIIEEVISTNQSNNQATKPKNPPKKQSSKATSKSKSKEDLIYQLVGEVEGISLTEIESQLDLARKVTIEAIRKLVQEGKLEQKDRLYYITK